ncbi:MAG: hypothetical protein MUF78_00620 [Candidatus Edwardsbacteria bacterium]|jgi:hypothetical protein|nr:hypothetical protein [Candidatus Edwardsbacteria bacterium]
MSALILWHDQRGSAETLARQLQAATGAAIEAIQTERPVGWFDRLLQRDVAIKPPQSDPKTHRLVIICCATPRGRLPIEVRSLLFQFRTRISALACVLIPDTFTTNTEFALADIERHASQRPVALVELPLRELSEAAGEASRPWIAQRKMELFRDQLKNYLQ